MANHRSPKPGLQVRLLPLLPFSVRDGGWKMMPSAAEDNQAARGTTTCRQESGNRTSAAWAPARVASWGCNVQ